MNLDRGSHKSNTPTSTQNWTNRDSAKRRFRPEAAGRAYSSMTTSCLLRNLHSSRWCLQRKTLSISRNHNWEPVSAQTSFSSATANKIDLLIFGVHFILCSQRSLQMVISHSYYPGWYEWNCEISFNHLATSLIFSHLKNREAFFRSERHKALD